MHYTLKWYFFIVKCGIQWTLCCFLQYSCVLHELARALHRPAVGKEYVLLCRVVWMISYSWNIFFFNFRSYYHTPTHHSNKSMIQLRAHLRFVLAWLRCPRLQRECNGQWQNGREGTQKEYMHGLVPFALHKQSQCLLGLLSCPLSFHQSSTKFSRLYYYFYIKEDLQNSRAPYLIFFKLHSTIHTLITHAHSHTYEHMYATLLL